MSNSCKAHPFDRAGLARLSDLRTEEWQALFHKLAALQDRFLAREPSFRSTEYKWHRDPLRTWSRAWEYPYVWHHLLGYLRQLKSERPVVADIGSGVTFFPFGLAAEAAAEVLCADIDPVCAVDIPRAAESVGTGNGAVAFRMVEGDALPYADGELDAAYCVSVLEHIPTFELTVRETARSLKPGGQLVLTFDLDINGTSEIGPSDHERLMEALLTHFDEQWHVDFTHPGDMLMSDRGPWPAAATKRERQKAKRKGLRRANWVLRDWCKRKLIGFRRPRTPLLLACQGLVLRRPRTP